MTTRSVGFDGEDKAVSYLEQKGYQIKARNFSSRFGELDVIAFHNRTIVFVEVKLRATEHYGSGLEAITRKKLSGLITTAQIYIKLHKLEHRPYRFDAVYIVGDSIEHIENITL